MDHEIKVIRSGRKTMALQIDPDAKVIVRVPYGLSDQEIERFVESHEKWINTHVEQMTRKMVQSFENRPEVLTREELEKLADQAVEYIGERALYFARKMKVRYSKITIRNQKTRWGSCSSRGNLNFNCLLMLAPKEVTDYIIVHELCHLKEMNHSEKFWKEVENVLPDYKERREWLKEHGNELIRRMTG